MLDSQIRLEARASASKSMIERGKIQRPVSDSDSTIQLNRPDDFVEVVLDLHRAVGERGAADAAAAEDAVEFVLVGACGRRPSRSGP